MNKLLLNRMTNSVQRPWFAMSSRVIAAIIGGYVLSNLIAIVLSYLLSMVLADSPVGSASANSVMIAIQLSYLIYAAIVMWVFSGKALAKVWRSLTLACLVCAFFIYIFMPEGLF